MGKTCSECPGAVRRIAGVLRDKRGPGGAGDAVLDSRQQQHPSGRSCCCSAARRQVAEDDFMHRLPRPHWVLLEAIYPDGDMLGSEDCSRTCSQATAACKITTVDDWFS